MIKENQFPKDPTIDYGDFAEAKKHALEELKQIDPKYYPLIQTFAANEAYKDLRHIFTNKLETAENIEFGGGDNTDHTPAYKRIKPIIDWFNKYQTVFETKSHLTERLHAEIKKIIPSPVDANQLLNELKSLSKSNNKVAENLLGQAEYVINILQARPEDIRGQLLQDITQWYDNHLGEINALKISAEINQILILINKYLPQN